MRPHGIALLALLAGILVAAPAGATQLLVNGDFESGNFGGWNVVNLPEGEGTFYIDNDTVTPIYPLGSESPTVGPAGGTYYAVSDAIGPGTHALLQSFVVPGDMTQVLLDFKMFVNNWNEVIFVDPIGLDHNGPPNQHGRVDLLRDGADAFSTDPSDVLWNFYIGADPYRGPDTPNNYSSYPFDITPYVSAGGTYQLRFAATHNQWYLNMGVDDVSVQAFSSSAVVPEPDTLSLTLVGATVFALLGYVVRVR